MGNEERFNIGNRSFVSRWGLDKGEIQVRVYEGDKWIITFSTPLEDSHKMEEAMGTPVVEQLKALAKEQAEWVCEQARKR